MIYIILIKLFLSSKQLTKDFYPFCLHVKVAVDLYTGYRFNTVSIIFANSCLPILITEKVVLSKERGNDTNIKPKNDFIIVHSFKVKSF